MHAFNLQLASPSVQLSYPLCKNYSVNWEKGKRPLVNGGVVSYLLSAEPSLTAVVVREPQVPEGSRVRGSTLESHCFGFS